MYLRRHGRKKGDCEYESWTLVESVRTAQGPRQRIVATLGKLPGMEKEERIGWEEIARILDGRARPEPNLFEKEEEIPAWAEVNLKGVSVERLRHFGDVYLGLALWKRLGLEAFCQTHIPSGREEIAWSVMAAVLVLARFCAPSSELQIAESWFEKSALDDLLGISSEKINDDRLYRALDALLPHKEALFQHLQQRYGELFQETFDFLFYDITSAYFEGSGEKNPQAKRGYSRDGRPDCVQVCIGLVVSREGLPLAFEVFDGNRTDVTTVEERVELMEEKYGQAKRVWVMDRGMVSEENLEFLRQRGARYLVGTPKSMLKRYEREMTEAGWEAVAPGVEVKRCAAPDSLESRAATRGEEETFILCRSEGRKEKEQAILNRFVEQLEAALNKMVSQAERVRRLTKRLLEEGERGLCHRSRGRPSNRRIALRSKEKILALYSKQYAGFGPTLAAEKLSERDQITLSDETLRLWLRAEQVAYPSRKKRPHRRWRERRGQLGELLQMDGSHHDWLEGRGPLCVLMAYIDDASSRMYARFYEYEGTFPAMDSFRRYVRRYGVPLGIYFDKHSTYKSTAKQTEEEQLLDSKPMSQFQRSLKELAVEVIHADSPQAKGRIERLFRTFQDRLVKEMRLKKIASIEEANRFLERYLPIYNKRFEVSPAKAGDLHRAAPPARELDRILCLKSERVLRKDWTLSYAGVLYQVEENIRAQKISVEERLDGSLHLMHRGRSLGYTEILSRPLKVQRPSCRTQTLIRPPGVKGKKMPVTNFISSLNYE